MMNVKYEQDLSQSIEQDATYKTIREVLDQWKDTELNIASESARHLLALAVHERMQSHITQLVEDIIYPEKLNY